MKFNPTEFAMEVVLPLIGATLIVGAAAFCGASRGWAIGLGVVGMIPFQWTVVLLLVAFANWRDRK